MSKELKQEDKWILDALSALLSGKEPVSPDEAVEESIISSARRYGMIPLLFPCIDSFSLPISREWIKKITQKSVYSFYKLMYMSLYITEEFKKAGIKFCILKGIDLACRYPVCEYRPFGDIDILITREEDVKNAVSILEKEGFSIKEKQDSDHHTALINKEGMEVELHTKAVRDFDSERINRRIRSIFFESDLEFKTQKIFGRDFLILPVAENALYLLLHMLQHYLNAGFGVKFLADWRVFWEKENSDAEIQKYKEYVSGLNISTFSDTVTYLACRYLGLSDDYGKKLMFVDISADDNKRETAELLMADILEAGRFGEDAERVVNVRNASFAGLFTEVHHQMKRNYPKASKCFILWPFLWLSSVLIFVRNNKKVRNTGTLRILKKSGDRGRLTNKLDIWKK